MIRNSSKQIDLILFDEVQLKNIRKMKLLKSRTLSHNLKTRTS